MSNDDVYKFPRLNNYLRGPSKSASHDWYDTAQICLNGDIVSSGIVAWPESAQPFCERCGAATISACPSCNTPLKGNLHMASGFTTPAPLANLNFCYKCGAMFPWAAKKLATARELADELALSDDEKEIIKERLPDIARDTPTAEASAVKVKGLLDKARTAGSVAAGVLYKVALDFASETAKKVLIGPLG